MKQVIDIVEKEDRSYGFNSSALVESGIEETAPSKIDNKKRGPGRPRTQDRGLYPSNTYTDIVTDDKEKQLTARTIASIAIKDFLNPFLRFFCMTFLLLLKLKNST